MNKCQVDVCEQLIMDGINPLICELLLVDVANLIAYLTFDQHHQIRDLVDSAAEQFFAAGFLAYRETGSVAVDWNKSPSIKLEMVMNTPCHAFEFLFIFENAAASVKLLNVNEHPDVGGNLPLCSTDTLKRAIEINTVQNLLRSASPVT